MYGTQKKNDARTYTTIAIKQQKNIDCIPVHTMIAYSLKRKSLSDYTNVENGNQTQSKKHSFLTIKDMMPRTSAVNTNQNVQEDKIMYLQNVHTILAMCKKDLVTDTFSDLLPMDNETKLLDFLAELGVIAKHYQYEFWGGRMRMVK